jgi:hypothetical protein
MYNKYVNKIHATHHNFLFEQQTHDHTANWLTTPSANYLHYFLIVRSGEAESTWYVGQ